MKISRRYQLLPSRATCHKPGCSWHRDGADAETVAEAHSRDTGHEVYVTAASVVIFNGRPALAGRPS